MSLITLLKCNLLFQFFSELIFAYKIKKIEIFYLH